MKINFLKPGCAGQPVHEDSWKWAAVIGLIAAFSVFLLACVYVSGWYDEQVAKLSQLQMQLAASNSALEMGLRTAADHTSLSEASNKDLEKATDNLGMLMTYDGIEMAEYDVIKQDCILNGSGRQMLDVRRVASEIKKNPRFGSVMLCEYSDHSRQLMSSDPATNGAVESDVLPMSYKFKVKIR